MTPTSARSTTRSAPWGPAAGGFPGGFGGGFGGRRRAAATGSRTSGDLGDMFGGLFGRGRAAAPAPGRAPARRRRGDRAAPVLRGRRPRGHHLGQRDHRRPLPHLRRVGGRPGHPARHLPALRGPGTLQDNQGLFSLSQICPQCGGRGTIVTTPAPPARAPGSSTATARSRCASPPGWRTASASGSRGGARPAGATAPSGDLYVVVRVGPPRPVRPAGAQPDPDRTGQLRRSRPGHHADRAHPRRPGDPAGPGRHARRAGPSGSRAGASRPARRAPPATCWSRWRWPCPTS